MVRKVSNIEKSEAPHVMLFGAPKSGKTELAGKLAEHFNLIWIDMEKGYETLFKLPKEWQDRITLITLPDTRSYPIAIETVLKMVKGAVSICDKHGKVGCMICKKEENEQIKQKTNQISGVDDTDIIAVEVHESLFTDVNLNKLGPDTIVVFDSATQLTNSAISNMTKNESDTYKLTWDDWGNLGTLMDVFYSHIQQAPYKVVVISHETEAETEGKKKTLVPVSGSRNFSRNVAKYFGHVVYCERKNKKHVFASSTQYATNILTGSRTDVTLEDSEEASLLQIFKPEFYEGGNTNKSKVIQTKPAGTGITPSSLLDKLKKQ